MLTSSLSVQLERTLGISANIWNNLNADYSLFNARVKEAEALKQKKEWITNFPVKELKKFGFLSSCKDTDTETMLWRQYYALRDIHYRKSPAFSDNLPHTASWLGLVRYWRLK